MRDTLTKDLENLRQESLQIKTVTNIRQFCSLYNLNLQMYWLLLYEKAPEFSMEFDTCG